MGGQAGVCIPRILACVCRRRRVTWPARSLPTTPPGGACRAEATSTCESLVSLSKSGARSGPGRQAHASKTPREVQEAEQAAAAASPSAHPSNSLSGASEPPLGIARLPRRRPPSGAQLGKSALLLSTAFATASIQALPPRRSSFDLLSRQLPQMTSLPPDPRVNIGPTLALPTEEHRAVAQFSLNARRVSACKQLAIRGYTLALLSGDGICGQWRNRICGMTGSSKSGVYEE